MAHLTLRPFLWRRHPIAREQLSVGQDPAKACATIHQLPSGGCVVAGPVDGLHAEQSHPQQTVLART